MFNNIIFKYFKLFEKIIMKLQLKSNIPIRIQLNLTIPIAKLIL